MNFLVVLARLVDLLYDADEDAEHHENYHIGAQVVSGSVIAAAIYLICVARRLLARFLLALLLHLVDLRHLLLNLRHQLGKKFSKRQKVEV